MSNVFQGTKNLKNTKPSNLPKKDALVKKPCPKVLKKYGKCLDDKHPFNRKQMKKKISGEDIFDKGKKNNKQKKKIYKNPKKKS